MNSLKRPLKYAILNKMTIISIIVISTVYISLALEMPYSIKVYRYNTDAIERPVFKDYVNGVLPNEWRLEWPDDALRAGAMAIMQEKKV
jgi:peptidoglycan hydrolase-like amidase